MRPTTRRPEAGTYRASLNHSRFSGNRPSDTAKRQAQSREKLDAAKIRLGISGAWRALGLPGEPRRNCRSPFREDRHPSFSITDDRLWHDFADGTGGDVVSFVKCATGCSDGEAITRVIEMAGGGLATGVTLAPRAVAAPQPITDNLAGLELRPPTLGEVIAIADLRKWPTFAGLELARLRGLLQIADVPWRGEVHPSWILTDNDRKSAQARRLDGEPWQGQAHTYKSNSLRTDPEHPPGLADVLACDRKAVLLCEGEPDALAALLLAWCADLAPKAGVIALTGASKDLPLVVLEKLRGRRVRILRQTDKPGHRCALAWAESLNSAGVTVDLANLDGQLCADGHPAKDLADLICRPAELGHLETLAAALLGNLVK